MAATQGTITFRGRSQRSYTCDVYLSDAANGAVNWDAGQGASATSPTHTTFEEDVLMVDAAVVTGAAQTKLKPIRNGTPTKDMLRHTLHLNTLAFRPILAIPFRARDEISMVQIA